MMRNCLSCSMAFVLTDAEAVRAHEGVSHYEDHLCSNCSEGGSNRKTNPVSKPAHYTGGTIECIDAIAEATKGLTGVAAFCVGNAMKYLWRHDKKNGTEDLEKARWYIDRLIAERKKAGKT